MGTAITLAEINRSNQEFWAERQLRFNKLLANKRLAEILRRREEYKDRFVSLATSDADRIRRLRDRLVPEVELENASSEFDYFLARGRDICNPHPIDQPSRTTPIPLAVQAPSIDAPAAVPLSFNQKQKELA